MNAIPHFSRVGSPVSAAPGVNQKRITCRRLAWKLAKWVVGTVCFLMACAMWLIGLGLFARLVAECVRLGWNTF